VLIDTGHYSASQIVDVQVGDVVKRASASRCRVGLDIYAFEVVLKANVDKLAAHADAPTPKRMSMSCTSTSSVQHEKAVVAEPSKGLRHTESSKFVMH
jgi:hypothetical protein